jgi:hypothetical protein
MRENTNLLTLSIKDFLTPKMLKFALVPFLVTLVIMYLLFFVVAGMGIEHLGTMNIESTQTTMQNGVPHTQTLSAELEGNAIVKFFMSYAITSWIVTFMIYALGGIATLYLSIFMTIIIIGFMTPYVLKELQIRHYQEYELIGHSNIVEGVWNMLRWALVMLLLFVLFIPLYFIPLVNIIALNFPLYYFFHKMLNYDIAATMLTREENKKMRYLQGSNLRLKTLALYLLSLIPFSVFFGAIFFVIYLGHSYFKELPHLREVSV